MELKIPEPLLQKHLESFQVALQDLRNDDNGLVLSVYRGLVVKAAMKAGWIEEADIGEMEAQEVVRLSAEITEKVTEVTAVSKN